MRRCRHLRWALRGLVLWLRAVVVQVTFFVTVPKVNRSAIGLPFYTLKIVGFGIH